MSADLDEIVAVIIDDADAKPAELLARALSRSGFWALLDRKRRDAGSAAGSPRIVIKPDLLAFQPASPAATDPRLVETLIDTLHDRGYVHVAVVAATDSSSLWSENRDVLAIADLLGYRFITQADRPYEILDLRENLIPIEFP